MHSSLAVFSFLLLSVLHSSVTVESFDTYSILQDLTEFNLTCEEKCGSYDSDSLSFKDCQCGRRCAQLDTCCIDSPYIYAARPDLKPACRTVQNNDHYFIVDQCSSTDSVWASLCNADDDLENGDDNIQKIVPVTSLFTSITYKNYYCYRCHETTDEYVYWRVMVEGDLPEDDLPEDDTYEGRSKRSAKGEHIFFAYNKDLNTWMASYDELHGYFSVKISVLAPYDVYKLTDKCIPNVISDCSDKWSDEETREKCQSYTAIKEVRKTGEDAKIYKNIHCALCNSENLNDIFCRLKQSFIFVSKVPFSFTYLLDINRSDGELVGKIQKCSGDHLWDPYTKKCRKLTCALPGYTLKNGKCVQ